jgi:hypothetical protein
MEEDGEEMDAVTDLDRSFDDVLVAVKDSLHVV